jgi:hypothetical protein
VFDGNEAGKPAFVAASSWPVGNLKNPDLVSAVERGPGEDDGGSVPSREVSAEEVFEVVAGYVVRLPHSAPLGIGAASGGQFDEVGGVADGESPRTRVHRRRQRVPAGCYCFPVGTQLVRKVMNATSAERFTFGMGLKGTSGNWPVPWRPSMKWFHRIVNNAMPKL